MYSYVRSQRNTYLDVKYLPFTVSRKKVDEICKLVEKWQNLGEHRFQFSIQEAPSTKSDTIL